MVSTSNGFAKKLSYYTAPFTMEPFYDLLPKVIKSHNFTIRFDMGRPASRFVIVHRAVKQFYSELNFAEKCDLVLTSYRFTDYFQLGHTSLVIPLGQWNLATKCAFTPNTFAAFIYVADQERYLQIFSQLCSQIPKWPNQKWVTGMWIPGSNVMFDPDCYRRSVLQASSQGQQRYEMFMERSGPRTWKPVIDTDGIMSPMEIKVVVSPSYPGIRGFSAIVRDHNAQPVPLSQWTVRHIVVYSDSIVNYAIENLSVGKRGCGVSLSLTGHIHLGHHSRVIGMIRMTEFCPKYSPRLSRLSETNEKSDDEQEVSPEASLDATTAALEEYHSDPFLLAQEGMGKSDTLEVIMDPEPEELAPDYLTNTSECPSPPPPRHKPASSKTGNPLRCLLMRHRRRRYRLDPSDSAA